MKNLSPIISILFIALLMPAVLAEIDVAVFSHEAEFSAPVHETRVCGCGSTVDTFTLENIGDFDATFSLNLETNEDWIEVPARRISLDAGEETQVAVLLNPECGLETESEYTIYANSEFGRYRAAERTVEVHTCQAISMQVLEHSRSVLPCRPAYYTIILTNTATYFEEYELSAESDGEVYFEQNSIGLSPGESQEVHAQVQWPCDEFGDRQVEFNVHAVKTDVDQKYLAEVDIQWDYSYLTSIRTQNICAEIDTDLVFTITNTATTDNTYELHLLNPDFAELKEDEVFLKAGEERTLALVARPTEDDIGERRVAIEILPEVGGNTRTETFTLNVRDCYENEVKIIPSTLAACAGPINVSVQVTNLGENPETFTLKSYGDIFSNPVDDQFWLRSGEFADVVLEVLMPDRNAEYEVIVETKQTPGLVSHETLNIESFTNAACTLIEPTSTEIDAYTDTGSIPVLLTNNGIKSSVYEVEYQGTKFAIKENDIFLAPNEEYVLHLIPQNLTEADAGEYVESLYLTSTRATYRYDFIIDLDNKNFLTKAYERIAFGAHGMLDVCLLIMLLLFIAILAVLFLLLLTWFGVIDGANMSLDSRSTAVAILAVLAAISIIVGIFVLFGTPLPNTLVDQRQGSDYTELYHEFAQQETYELKVNRYFTDPDNDQLQYAASTNENLKVRIDDEIAYIKANNGFSGIERIVFSATDAQGATTDSPVMTIRVLKERPVGFWQSLAWYCHGINWILLGILFLLIIIGLFSQPNKKMKEEYGDKVRALIPMPVQTVPAETVVIHPSEQKIAPQVQGDVVAGDKITYVGSPKNELFVASSGGKKIHRSECPIAMRITKEKRIVYESRSQAVQAGYSPCRLCRPFE